MSDKIKAQVVVLGSGPGGYSAAFRAADLGLETVLVERYSTLGGVCLNVGCIPSKALLHLAKHIEDAKVLANEGVEFGEPKIDLDKIRKHKEKVVGQLTGGLGQMSKMRKVKVVNGYGKFTSSNTLNVEGEDGNTEIEFENAIIAAGSQPIKLPFIPHDDERIWDSTDALELKEIPEKMLLLGGGIIALEMGQVYSSLGSKVDVVEMTDQLVPPADADIMKSFNKQVKGRFENVMLSTKATKVEAKKDGIYVTFEGKGAPEKPVKYDVVLTAVGRAPNGKKIDADKAGVKVTEQGFIEVDSQMRTNVDNIFAIGDIVGQPMLAHKAVHESHVAAEVIAGKKHFFEPKVIPSIMYTDPEVAWAGVTEKEAKEKGIEYEAVTFPWSASGRAIASNAQQGMTKLIFDKNNRIIGGSMCGSNAGELLGEVCLAIEMGCDAEDIALTVHAHPTLHESIGLAAEIQEGSITDMPNPKAKKKK
ncbi:MULTISPECIES: dihydrolipoyl dehydrogenase [unclassified Idiomarina]|jgi:dihydrolipoamide dehydrogenase|uniref:dihydrolipoyl dehydrogenase n=1 Tax=unclassified Idiomarina TaxID=2614829 RepID=UPI000C60FC55|nr:MULTISPECIES: dihydrolipoyl dehydrogenase [unclassified Idiomarina]MAD52584.1 dihydrolipoyl dehydrogenase [Idiomarinaceae bacterium]MEC7643279.1 dihydrolipoyl dehydrogenase [Pseudomonadota bacterium]MBL74135.1 dihydrolipoyl dehydrogenase [Idiomarinaceae bacterium]MEC8926328.1 dihydrolipoyl dehydrogenase [Pseudomonadota bacterium]NQZ03342.1 dihydrolipoyl dehydrogenase [Idiomarina sp.]|tara:strand:+ start:2750 stop:4177 length:1428 start_codon:yes stop_codon:yes gene_type:complete